MQKQGWRERLTSDTGLLVLVALASFLVHMLLNNRYGFHRDELAMVDYSRRLAWGYVEFPPLTPFLVRTAMTIFGDSPWGARVFSSLGQAVIVLLVGLMARDFGAGRRGQLVAAAAAAISPVALLGGSMTQYQSFDYLWWVTVLWALLRVERTQNPRWWLAVGLFFGLGLMTKYTILVLAAALAMAMVLTPMRRWLRSPWLWAGAGLAMLIWLPNLLWQAQNGWIALEFTATIHARDVAIGRTQDFLANQLYVNANPLLIPLWIAGLLWLLLAQKGKFRAFGLLWLAMMAILIAVRGRDYYAAGTYPMLLAGGGAAWESWLAHLRPGGRKLLLGATVALLLVGALLGAVLALPIAPVNTALWDVSAGVHDVFLEQLNWPELIEAVAGVWAALPEEQRAYTGVYAGNYGEAGALNLYGPRWGLPRAFSAINTYWLWGPPDPAPEQVIVVGYRSEWLSMLFPHCELAAPIPNPLGIENEETTDYDGIYLCTGTHRPWAELWREIRHFG